MAKAELQKKTVTVNKEDIGKLLEKITDYNSSMKESLTTLASVGGYKMIESSIEGSQNLNPERKARKNIFLSDSSKGEEREQLKRTLEVWASALNSSEDIDEMISMSIGSAEQAEKTFNNNIGKALNKSRNLERSYRSVAFFFKNTGQDKLKNLVVMNAEIEQLKDLDNPQFIDAVREEFINNYDRLDLRDNYGLLIIPGYLGSNKVIEKWAKIAHENKVMMITDFEDFDAPDDVMEMFESANLSAGDAYKSNVIMACNWLVGRAKEQSAGEEDDLFVPPSGALAGTMYKTLMSQVAAGKKHGSLSEVDGVKFPLKKSEIAHLEKIGLVPMVNEYGKVMAYSAKTLFNGDNLGLQTYSVVRVFDYVTKVLMDFLNRRAFENFNMKTKRDIQGQIIRFLDSITGPGKLIESFSIKRFEQDPKQKDRVFIDISMKPYFPAKNFLLKMDGQKGDDGTEWDTDYEQN